MDTIDVLQPTDEEEQLDRNKGSLNPGSYTIVGSVSQEQITGGSSEEKSQTKTPSPTNLRPSTNNDSDNLKTFGNNIKRVVRYVKIQVPPSDSKAAQGKAEQLPVVELSAINSSLVKRNPIKVKLKPPRKINSEVVLVPDEHNFQEEIEVENVVKTSSYVHKSVYSRPNYHDSKKLSDTALKKKKTFMEQETQTEIFGWLYKNEKLYSVVCGKYHSCTVHIA